MVTFIRMSLYVRVYVRACVRACASMYRNCCSVLNSTATDNHRKPEYGLLMNRCVLSRNRVYMCVRVCVYVCVCVCVCVCI